MPTYGYRGKVTYYCSSVNEPFLGLLLLISPWYHEITQDCLHKISDMALIDYICIVRKGGGGGGQMV
jgi:hypothetical protein